MTQEVLLGNTKRGTQAKQQHDEVEGSHLTFQSFYTSRAFYTVAIFRLKMLYNSDYVKRLNM